MQPSRLKAIRGLAASLALLVCVGCETDAAGETVPTVAAEASSALAAAEPLDPIRLDKPAAAANPGTNAPAADAILSTNAAAVNLSDAAATTNATPVITEEIPPARPANLKISEAAEKVIKLAESNLDEKVILAFVEQTPAKFELDADEILYLSDVGVPSTVVAAMLKHDGDDPTKADAITAAQNTEKAQPALPANTNLPPAIAQQLPPQQQIEVTTNYIPNQQVVVQQPPQTVVVEQAPTVVYSQPEDVSYFYNSLSPYGSWFYVSDYGWCWQPTVAVIDRGWRPYGHRGNWVWTTSGWYWHSDYSWGWAPFHYGRWHLAGARGWLWVPDRVWGPAWVSWRSSGDYCGWAPLPPAAVFRPGFGFSFHGRSVDVSFGFGLGYDAFCFAPVNRFHHRRVYDYCLPRYEVRRIYPHSRVENHFEYRHDRREFVNRSSGRLEQGLRPAVVRDLPEHDRNRWGNRERVERDSRQTVVYRPAPPANVANNFSGQRVAPNAGTSRERTNPNWSPRTRAEVTTRPSTVTGTAAPAPAPESRVADPASRAPNRVSRDTVVSRPVENRPQENRPQVITRPSTLNGNTPAPTPVPSGRVADATRRDRGAVAIQPIQTPAPTPAPAAVTPAPQPTATPEPSRSTRAQQVFTRPGATEQGRAAWNPNPVTRRPLADASPSTTPIPGAPTINNTQIAPPQRTPPVSAPATRIEPPSITRREYTREVAPAPQISTPSRSFNTAPPPVQRSAPPTTYSRPITPSAPPSRAPVSTPAPITRSPAVSAPAAVSRAPAVTQTPISRSEPRQAPQSVPSSPSRRGRGD